MYNNIFNYLPITEVCLLCQEVQLRSTDTERCSDMRLGHTVAIWWFPNSK